MMIIALTRPGTRFGTNMVIPECDDDDIQYRLGHRYARCGGWDGSRRWGFAVARFLEQPPDKERAPGEDVQQPKERAEHIRENPRGDAGERSRGDKGDPDRNQRPRPLVAAERCLSQGHHLDREDDQQQALQAVRRKGDQAQVDRNEHQPEEEKQDRDHDDRRDREREGSLPEQPGSASRHRLNRGDRAGCGLPFFGRSQPDGILDGPRQIEKLMP